MRRKNLLFGFKNEAGEPLMELVLDGRKDLTRRNYALEPGRALAFKRNFRARAEGYGEVVSCVSHAEWWAKNCMNPLVIQQEAKREGFGSWAGLERAIIAHYGKWPAGMYRIEFKRKKE